jgi:pilus assembly protein CpaC
VQSRTHHPRNNIRLPRILSFAIAFLLAAAPVAHATEPVSGLKPSLAEAAVERPITIGLDKSVQIDLAADVREISISNPGIVEAVVRTARRVHLIGQKVGQATASFIGQDGRPILTLDVSVERDLAPVAAMIRRLMPKADVRLEAMNDNIVLSGSVASPIDATRIADIAGRFVSKREQVLNMLNVEAKEQVLLKVNVVEMNRSIIRRLGVDIREALATGNVAAVKIAENAFPLTAGAAPALALGTVAGSLSGAGSGNVVGLGWGNGKARIDTVLQALERNGLARVLAEPNLTSVSGETAKFLAGGEYPVPVSGGDRNGTSVIFKPFGVGLSFTPVVLSAGRISLQIETEVSELSNDGAVTVYQISVPALRVRRASSTLELPSGGSLVMAGLISSQTRRNVDGLPGLRNLPILGALFRSEEFVRSETELVVIVTPILVGAAAADALSTPGDGGPTRGEPVAVQSLTEPGGEAFAGYGYIVE